VSVRSRTENFDAISLSDSLEGIRNAKKIITTAMNRGNWVLLHYARPTEAAADMLVDVFTLMGQASVNTNFRLIVLCSSVQYLSPSMIAKSKRICIDNLPSVRYSMLHIFHHHSQAIRSATNPRAMKKLAYTGALLLSLFDWRGFIQPIGLNAPFQPSDCIFRDFLETLRAIITVYPTDIPLRNLRRYLEEVTFSFVSDRSDRRVLKSYIQALFIPETTDDGFTALKKSPDSDLWMIPGDVPLSNYIQIVQQLPIFAKTDILGMHTTMTAPIRNWNLSRWALRPFLDYAGTKIPIDKDSCVVRIDNIVMLLPERVGTGDSSHFETVCSKVLISEIDKLNAVLHFVAQRLADATTEVKNGIILADTEQFVNGEVPDEWKRRAEFYCTKQITKFTSHLIQRHAFLMSWLREGRPRVVDARTIDDLKGFMLAFLSEAALEKEVALEELTYDFQLVSGTVSESDCGFLLTNLYLYGGAIEEDKLTVKEDDQAVAFEQVAGIFCKVVRKVTKTVRFFHCPLYRTAFIDGLNRVQDDTDCGEGESKNFVWECPLITDKSDKRFVDFGTALFCRVPDQFA
jgi:hypothetical protein